MIWDGKAGRMPMQGRVMAVSRGCRLGYDAVFWQ